MRTTTVHLENYAITPAYFADLASEHLGTISLLEVAGGPNDEEPPVYEVNFVKAGNAGHLSAFLDALNGSFKKPTSI